MPRVSIILSSYNHAPYVAEAIESVLNQTFKDFELLIYDDGSVDGSQEVIRSFHDDRIRLFLYKENRGPLAAAMEAFQAARGEYIAVHHSDDVWVEDKLEKQAAFLDGHPECAACFSWASFIDEDNLCYELEAGNFYREAFQKENRPGVQWLRYFFSNPNCLCHPSLLIRREMYWRHKMFPPEGMWQLPDFYMWLRLLAGGEEIYICPEPLVKFRLRRNAKTGNTSGESRENTLRRSYEYMHIARIYGNLSPELFCKVFPGAAGDVVDGDIRLALGKKCISSDIPAYRFFGLELLFGVLNDAGAGHLREIVHYGLPEFLRYAGQCDCFGLARNMRMARMSMFFDCGDGWRPSEITAEEHYIRNSGEFFVSFSIDVPIGTWRLRFDPDEETIVRVLLKSFQVNGAAVQTHSNGVREEDGYDAFYHGDPIYEVEGSFSGTLGIEIGGMMQYPHEAGIISEFYHRNMELGQSLAETRQSLAETRQSLAETRQSLAEMEQSRSWRCTAPLRQAGKCIRKWMR